MDSKRIDRKRLGRTIFGALLGVALLAGSTLGSARAADDDDEDVAFDTKILREILRSFGLRNGSEAGIDYRERSPLVVPSSRNLPAPGAKASAEKGPAWPVDVDVKRRKEARTASKDRRSIDWEAESRPMSPGELRGGGPPTGSQVSPDNRNSENFGPMKASELGYKGGLFSSLFGGPKEEYTTFTGEVPRSSLIEPPTGYRTPSPYQPYGVGKEKWVSPVIDRHEVVR